MRSDSSACFSVQAMVRDQNRCTEKRVRGFHLWEGKMRKHLSHNEYNLIMVIGRPLLFNDCCFSASPLIPVVNIMWLSSRHLCTGFECTF